MTVSLDSAPIGVRARVKNISDGNIGKKLMEMGIVPGTEIFVEGMAPLGDPIKISVRGYKLALRKNEAKRILAEI
ncbi:MULTISPECIES: FeoA family protein [Tepidanaerobacter]|uniref:Ferrous iron transport protein A n=1 Tax=Tepidanaerobacter syntrophicus TaxID=224999 RepID=A0A0U9HF69_9FIRM|nr:MULTISPECIES: FeoA family protein [Tepidanaerobacter]GAQ25472.1 ferrous iron transport protein A [Tepidanaerobacter syntrophicus]GLI19980.1 iron transporter FeoA [Tepidanaerobacter syntrophicus]HHV82455.1 ferrous iron transport protein A [Tepidanaerobacter syntrophicus]